MATRRGLRGARVRRAAGPATGAGRSPSWASATRRASVVVQEREREERDEAVQGEHDPQQRQDQREPEHRPRGREDRDRRGDDRDLQEHLPELEVRVPIAVAVANLLELLGILLDVLLLGVVTLLLLA